MLTSGLKFCVTNLKYNILLKLEEVKLALKNSPKYKNRFSISQPSIKFPFLSNIDAITSGRCISRCREF